MNPTSEAIKKRYLSHSQQAQAETFERAIVGEAHSFDFVVTWLKGRQRKVKRGTKPLEGLLAVEAAMAIAGRNVDPLRRLRTQLDVA